MKWVEGRNLIKGIKLAKNKAWNSRWNFQMLRLKLTVLLWTDKHFSPIFCGSIYSLCLTWLPGDKTAETQRVCACFHCAAFLTSVPLHFGNSSLTFSACQTRSFSPASLFKCYVPQYLPTSMYYCFISLVFLSFMYVYWDAADIEVHDKGWYPSDKSTWRHS